MFFFGEDSHEEATETDKPVRWSAPAIDTVTDVMFMITSVLSVVVSVQSLVLMQRAIRAT